MYLLATLLDSSATESPVRVPKFQQVPKSSTGFVGAQIDGCKCSFWSGRCTVGTRNWPSKQVPRQFSLGAYSEPLRCHPAFRSLRQSMAMRTVQWQLEKWREREKQKEGDLWTLQPAPKHWRSSAGGAYQAMKDTAVLQMTGTDFTYIIWYLLAWVAQALVPLQQEVKEKILDHHNQTRPWQNPYVRSDSFFSCYV